MATRLIVSNSVFLDTAYAIALASITDEFHPQALALAVELKRSRTPLVTTSAILLEIGNALSRLQHRHAFIHILCWTPGWAPSAPPGALAKPRPY